MRLYASNNGAWGIIEEEDFAIIECSDFSDLALEEVSEAPDSLKVETALNIRTALDAVEGHNDRVYWNSVPDLLEDLLALLDSKEQVDAFHAIKEALGIDA